MVQEQHAVTAFGDIDLENADAALQGVLHRFEGVFRIAGGKAAAMGGHDHAAGFPQAVEQGGQLGGEARGDRRGRRGGGVSGGVCSALCSALCRDSGGGFAAGGQDKG